MIAKTAVGSDNLLAPNLFYSSARDAMQDFLAAVIGTGEGKVLLPAYIGWSPREGSGVFDPVANLELDYSLYPVNSDLSARVDVIEEHLRTGAVAVVVVIHYFGRTDPAIEEIARLAGDAGAFLVEDLAHGFFSAKCGELAGRYADANLYSLHKMLPMPDGGMIQYRNPRLLTTQRETRPELSSRLLNYDWHGIAAIRSRNFNAAVDELKSLPGFGDEFQLPWDSLNGGDVPQTLPIRILRGSRDELYNQLNERGVGMVSLYHTLIEQARGQFNEVDRASRQMINFPVHQDVDRGQVIEGVRVFGEVLNRLA